MTSGEGGDQATVITALAAELTHARWRGLDRLGQDTHGLTPRTVPTLEGLARRYTNDEQSDRVPLIRVLLRDALDAWQRAGFSEEAAAVRGLFFHADGGTPGRHTSKDLLLAVRGDMSEDAFRRRREYLFRQFATHLVAFTAVQQLPATLALAAPPPPAPDRRSVLLLAGAVLLLLVVTGGAAMFGAWTRTRTPGTATGGPTTPPAQPVVPTGPSGRLLMFRFDGLGGNPTIRVFPDVTAPEEQELSGTYLSGERMPAVCKTIGILVRSKPEDGERPRESNVWIRIAGSPGKTQYARLTYGDMAPEDLDALPQCAGG